MDTATNRIIQKEKKIFKTLKYLKNTLVKIDIYILFNPGCLFHYLYKIIIENE